MYNIFKKIKAVDIISILKLYEDNPYNPEIDIKLKKLVLSLTVGKEYN